MNQSSGSSGLPWVVGISGASGTCYARRLLSFLAASGVQTHVVISEGGYRVLAEEDGLNVSPAKVSSETLLGERHENITFYHPSDVGARIASGTFRTAGMVVIPCSMSTLGALAHGVQRNLLHRAADVTLKEERKLIVVPRETPLSEIHLLNLLQLKRIGVSIVPAMPGFYHRPTTLDHLVDMMVTKVLDVMGIANNLIQRWKENE